MSLKLKINNKNLLANLSKSFTGDDNLFKELAQNARRAKASQVNITVNLEDKSIIFEDDGIGIDDFQHLFTIAESGWDMDTQEKENPFGLGFLMAIYSCDGIIIESNRKKLEANKSEILEFNELDLQDTNFNDGTRITLKGVKESILNFTQSHNAFIIFSGFNIPVYVNNEAIDRPFSLEALKQNDKFSHYQTELGDFFLNQKGFRRINNIDQFFQGFKLGSHYKYFAPYLITHLKEDEFEVRVPDRDVLINKESENKRICNSINKILIDKILEHQDDFNWLCNHYDDIKSHDLLHLFNKFDKIPKNILGTFPCEQISNCYTRGTLHLDRNRDVFTREELNKMVIIEDNFEFDLYDQSNDFAIPVYLERIPQEYAILVGELDKDHWIYKNVIDKEKILSELEIRVNNQRERILSKPFYTDYEFRFCDSYTLESIFGSVEVNDVALALFLDNKEIALIPEKEYGSGIILQVCNFNVDGGYDESMELQHEKLFDEWLLQERAAGDPSKYLNLLIKEYEPEILKGKEFFVSFNEKGEVSITEKESKD